MELDFFVHIYSGDFWNLYFYRPSLQKSVRNFKWMEVVRMYL